MDSDIYYSNGKAWQSGTNKKKGTVMEHGAISDGRQSTSQQNYGSGGSRSGGVSAVSLPAFDYGAALREARERREAAAEELRDSMYALADKQYQTGADNLNNRTDKALQENYIAKRLAQRNLGQNLSAVGKSGGASETTMLGLENNYGTARGGVEEARLEGLAQLEQQRAAAKAQADQQMAAYLMEDGLNYNTLLAQAQANAANSSAQSIMDSYNAAVARATSAQKAANQTATGGGYTPPAQKDSGADVSAMVRAIANWRNAPSDQYRNTDTYKKTVSQYLNGQGYSTADIAKLFNTYYS